MKTKITVACIAITFIIISISCNWFSSSEPKPQAFNIEGEWVIDSIENKGSDSSNFIGMLALALAAKDSLPVRINFNDDSTYRYTNVKDTIKGNYYLSDDANSLFIKEDSVTHQFSFIERSDSAVTMASADSLVYYLKRK